jgi:hypothetical protein
VVHDGGVLDLRAEEDQLGVALDPHAVPGGPVDEVTGGTGLIRSLAMGDDDVAGDHIAPVAE